MIIGDVLGGAGAGAVGGTIIAAGNVAIEVAKAGGKVAGKVLKKGAEVGGQVIELGKLQLKILKMENKIKDIKYNIGRVIYDNKIDTKNDEIKNEVGRISRCINEIKALKEEISKTGGNVEEIEKAIQLYNQQYVIIEKEKVEAIDDMEETKKNTSKSVGERHKAAESYIREVAEEIKNIDEEIDTDKLMSDLEEM